MRIRGKASVREDIQRGRRKRTKKRNKTPKERLAEDRAREARESQT